MSSASDDGLFQAGAPTESKIVKSTFQGPKAIRVHTLVVSSLDQITAPSRERCYSHRVLITKVRKAYE